MDQPLQKHPCLPAPLRWSAPSLLVCLLLLFPVRALCCSTATGTLASLAITPASASIDIGQTQQFTATATCTDGSLQDLTALVAWSSSDITVASITASGLATGLKSGAALITAHYLTPLASLSASAQLTVARQLVSLAVTPVNPSLAVNSSLQFSATGAYSDGSTQDLTHAVTWASSDSAIVAINSTGLATALQVGATTISATQAGITGATTLTVIPPASALVVTPGNPHLLRNGVLAFHAMVGSKDVTNKVTWSSSSTGVATINAGGQAQALGLGTTTIGATLGVTQGSTTLTVTTALPPVFTAPPTDTNVSATINPAGGVRVQLTDNLFDPLPGQLISMAIESNPTGKATLSGTLAQTTGAAGVATFPDLSIDWAGSAYTLQAGAAPISGPVSGTSAAFNEIRVGDICLGPDKPACQGACADADGDGLNDAWEIAGGVDLNGDGKITDPAHDLMLPGADPHKPDIYVRYDWLDYAPPGNGCSPDNDICSLLGFAHRGEKCIGPQLNPSYPASCAYACNTDSDCTTGPTNTCSSNADCGGRSYCDPLTSHCSVGQWHTGERCINNMCQHTHDPDLLAPGSLQLVADRFADHGIDLHLLRGQALPHSQVVSYRSVGDMTDGCEGGSLASGDAGPGEYAESLYDLKHNSDPDISNIALHYALFAHYVGCDSTEHCQPYNSASHLGCPVALNPDGTPKNAPQVGASGLAEISGNDFVVSLGGPVNDQAFVSTYFQPATFMHELGHNLGLHHGGGIDTPCNTNADCPYGVSCLDAFDGQGPACHMGEDDPVNKPNYLSVMNYRYQAASILVADPAGGNMPLRCSSDSQCPHGSFCFGSCLRIDYSDEVLPTGGNTPTILTESNLNEPAGLGAKIANLFTYRDGRCDLTDVLARTQGPVDWDGDGDASNPSAQADLINTQPTTFCPGGYFGLPGHADWPDASGIPFNYKFQCTSLGGPLGDGASATTASSTTTTASVLAARWQNEWSPDWGFRHHLAYPMRVVRLRVSPGCSARAIMAGTHGQFTVGLLGEPGFDVHDIDPSSLSVHGAKPAATRILDLDGDGRPDLQMTFDRNAVHLHPNATRLQVSGWLRNTQAFFGEVALPKSAAASECR